MTSSKKPAEENLAETLPAHADFVDSGPQFGYSEVLARCCAWGLCVFTLTRPTDGLR